MITPCVAHPGSFILGFSLRPVLNLHDISLEALFAIKLPATTRNLQHISNLGKMSLDSLLEMSAAGLVGKEVINLSFQLLVIASRLWGMQRNTHTSSKLKPLVSGIKK
jgi:hypothetical protein